MVIYVRIYIQMTTYHGVGAKVMKNCEPFVFGPELA